MAGYQYKPFEYHRAPGLDKPEPRHPVVIIGAGPIGLAMAIDLALRNVPSVVLDDNNVVSVGSRAICWSKRTLEIFGRLGVGERMLEKGVTWKVGRLFHGSKEVYSFDLLPEEGHKYPAFINLQQYYVEEYLVDRAREFPDLIDIRFKNKVVDHKDAGSYVSLSVETPDGNYTLEADYLLACDGAGSPTRNRMQLPFEGQTFEEQFLIVDVEMEESPFGVETPERWFWFEPDFHNGQSALLHRQPDNIYRIDLQLGPDADARFEAAEEQVIPRINAVVGQKPFKLDWKSVYRFRCARLDRFLHNRVIFVGDSAHVVSPFGARGGNGGIQDVDNLGWKLEHVIKGKAEASLLETYNLERTHASDENILNSSRATNFMTPKSPVEAMFRSEVLRLAGELEFARKLINSGRLSQPCSLSGFMNDQNCAGKLATGSSLLDAPLANGEWLIEKIPQKFLLLGFGEIELPKVEDVERISVGKGQFGNPGAEPEGDFAFNRYGIDVAYLVRPDGYVAGSFDQNTIGSVGSVLDECRGLPEYKVAAHG